MSYLHHPLALGSLLLAGCMGPYEAPPLADADGDGYAEDVDCDDADPAVHPGAMERCDEVDADCDGDPIAGAVDALPWYRDIDGDSYGDPDDVAVSCTQRTGHVLDSRDCDDRDPDIHPAADEVCDEVDQDCDGAVDEDAPGAETWHPDGDGDGFGDPDQLRVACEAPEGWVLDETDCDDSAAAVYPHAPEVCDDLDNDCDGLIDADDSSVDPDSQRRFTRDSDDDGYGAVGGASTVACSEPAGYALNDEDCDDSDPDISPAAEELWYDGVDSDCDGQDDFDADADGWALDEGDCDDADPSVSPDAVELWYDGVDSDCDGRDDFDADADGFAAMSAGGEDCDDADVATHPYAWEDLTDGLDNDCDGLADADDPEPALELSLSEDGWTTLSLTLPVEVCGALWTAVDVGADGLLSLSGVHLDDGESAAEFTAEGPLIAGLWDDLHPGAGGVVAWVEHPDAVSVYWRDVPETATGGANRFSITLLDDARVYLSLDALSATDGLVGWSCGDPGAPEADLSALSWVSGSAGLGQGTEGALYEVFTAADNDLSGAKLMLCGVGGADEDGDGWTARCGDPDDQDAAVTP